MKFLPELEEVKKIAERGEYKVLPGRSALKQMIRMHISDRYWQSTKARSLIICHPSPADLWDTFPMTISPTVSRR